MVHAGVVGSAKNSATKVEMCLALGSEMTGFSNCSEVGIVHFAAGILILKSNI